MDLLAASMVLPGMPSRSKWMRRKYSPTICRSEWGSSIWISATRPAIEFSIGIMARSAVPMVTSSKASSKLAHGTLSMSGNISMHAILELAPGSPWYAIFLGHGRKCFHGIPARDATGR